MVYAIVDQAVLDLVPPNDANLTATLTPQYTPRWSSSSSTFAMLPRAHALQQVAEISAQRLEGDPWVGPSDWQMRVWAPTGADDADDVFFGQFTSSITMGLDDGGSGRMFPGGGVVAGMPTMAVANGRGVVGFWCCCFVYVCVCVVSEGFLFLFCVWGDECMYRWYDVLSCTLHTVHIMVLCVPCTHTLLIPPQHKLLPPPPPPPPPSQNWQLNLPPMPPALAPPLTPSQHPPPLQPRQTKGACMVVSTHKVGVQMVHLHVL